VRFLGRRGDVGAVMAAADIFAMPSHEEPFGLVFLEAMAMERPVVALADGGTLEVVDHDRNGLLSSWKDADQLVANLSTLIADPARRAAMGECGRHHVIERFTVQRMAADVAALYRRIAASTR
ncbi:MAG: glycosyltransferase family 4 protein, partial [Ilumatobacteraceae bacterium]